MDRMSDLARRALHSIRTHPVVTVLLTVGAALAIVFSALVGLEVVITIGLLLVIATGSWLLWRWWSSRQAPGSVEASTARTGRVVIGAVVVASVLTFGLIQLVPFGRDHSNPPVTGEPQWASAQTRELMVDACFACHSNEVDYPAYASVAPISWAIQDHVEEGREKVNYSEFATDPGKAEDSIEVIEEGEMPPAYFTRFGLHAAANLTDAERQELIDGLRNTPGLTEGG
jgi:mono/diheme cytochrome c family protein